MLVVERLLGLRAAGGVYVALGGGDPRPRGMVAATWTSWERLLQERHARRGRVPREARLGARAHPRDRRRHAPRRALRQARALRLDGGCKYPRSAGARWRASARAGAGGGASGRPLMVRAGAGTGKTTVLVERFVRAVVEDGAGVEQMLAITFTEKAARCARVRRRFVELGLVQEARGGERLDLDHPRPLRSHPAPPPPARDRPGFRVLDELDSSASRSTPSILRSRSWPAARTGASSSRPPTRRMGCATCAPRTSPAQRGEQAASPGGLRTPLDEVRPPTSSGCTACCASCSRLFDERFRPRASAPGSISRTSS